MPQPIIKVQGLKRVFRVPRKKPGFTNSLKSLFKKEYKTVKAVDNISFQIKKGEFVGLIGPNGAGKTTTLKILSGILHPTSGSAHVMDFLPHQRKENFQKQISLVMGQKNQLWWDLPPTESFLLNKQIYDIPDSQYQETLKELIDLFKVKDILDVQVRKLSLGQRMKCELIASLLHQPKVLFLDEPTIGLDVVMQENIRSFIREYNGRFKATIILTSHYMDDVKKLCKRVIVIDKGKIIFDGELKKIIQKYAPEKTIEVIFAQEIDPSKLAQIGKIQEFSFPRATISVKRSYAAQKAAKLLESFPVDDLNINEIPIEDIIRKVFSK